MIANAKNIERLHSLVCRTLFYRTGRLSYARVLEAIGKLADMCHGVELDDWIYIGEPSAACTDDLLVGTYWFCSDFHSGQSSDEYRTLSQIGRVFSPGPMQSGPDHDTAEIDVYLALQALEGPSTLRSQCRPTVVLPPAILPERVTMPDGANVQPVSKTHANLLRLEGAL